MSPDAEKRLLDELVNLLEKQIELSRRGSLAALMRLTNEGEPLVARTAEDGLLDKPEHKAAKARLTGLYRELQLLLSAQQGEVAEQLKSVRKGKKTLSIYRGSV
jgi:hypothetical protein